MVNENCGTIAKNGVWAYPDQITLLVLPCDNEQTIENEPIEDQEHPGVHFWYRCIPNQEGKLRYDPRPSGVCSLQVDTGGQDTVRVTAVESRYTATHIDSSLTCSSK